MLAGVNLREEQIYTPVTLKNRRNDTALVCRSVAALGYFIRGAHFCSIGRQIFFFYGAPLWGASIGHLLPST